MRRSDEARIQVTKPNLKPRRTFKDSSSCRFHLRLRKNALNPPRNSRLFVGRNRVAILGRVHADRLSEPNHINCCIRSSKTPNVRNQITHLVRRKGTRHVSRNRNGPVVACCSPKRWPVRPGACYPNRNSRSLQRPWKEAGFFHLEVLAIEGKCIAAPEPEKNRQSLVEHRGAIAVGDRAVKCTNLAKHVATQTDAQNEAAL